MIVYDGVACLADWLDAEGYRQRDDMVCVMVANGVTDDEIEKQWDRIVEEFYDWCEDNGVEPDY